MTYNNGNDPEPESDYRMRWKEFDINYDIYGNIYGITTKEQSKYLSSRNGYNV